MKKSLLVLAVLAAWAGAAAAQQISNVTIYGVIDAGIGLETGSKSGNRIKETGGGETPSRFGFKGSEDLGGGMKASMVLEGGFTTDTGASAQGGLLFGRQAWVALEGGFGALSVGRQYTPLFMTAVESDPFAVGLSGNIQSLPNYTAQTRFDNAVRYMTPTFGGVSVELMYSLGEQANNFKAASGYGASIGYESGPLLVKLAHQNNEKPAGTIAGGPAFNSKRSLLVARYKFDYFTGFTSFGTNKSDVNSNQYNANTRDYLVGVKAPFGQHVLMAEAVRKQDKNPTNLSATMYAVGYSYLLSKRTDLYASYGHIASNAPNTSPALQGFYPVADGADPGTGSGEYLVGIRHRF